MTKIRSILSRNAALPRVAPFILFLALTALQGKLGSDSQFWVYLSKTILGAWMVWIIRPLVPEMKLAVSWQAVAAGVLVFCLWIGLDGLYPRLNDLFGSTAASSPSWNPFAAFGHDSPIAWLHISARIAGSALVVPFLEEVFYRSFLYRWIIKPDFLSIGFGEFNVKAFVISALVFGFAHQEWLAGILCAMIYQGLVLRKGRLGDAIVAHAITNLLLGCWVVSKGAWHFW